MKFLVTLILAAVAGAMTGMAQAPLQIVTDDNPASVFGGATAQIRVTFANASGQDFDNLIRIRIFQAASATVVPVGDMTWKQLHVLSGQTVLESARLEFPAVKAKTKFLVRWLENTNRVIGTTEVEVYPTNLLAGQKPLLGEATMGVLDPNNELKPLLRQNGVKFVDLEQTALEDFSGSLAILGPFHSKSQLPENAASRCKMMATHGTAVLWLRPPDASRDRLLPSYLFVTASTNSIVVADAKLVENLQENPESQLRLVELCRQALHLEPATLNDLNNQ